MSTLEKITTIYNETEDRICITGIDADSKVVSLWLTQRLALRLLQHLFKWLEPNVDSSSKEVTQSFSQDAAKSTLKNEKAVQSANTTLDCLVVSIDISPIQDSLLLTFRGHESQSSSLSVTELQLRQWLEILYLAWKHSQWPTSAWPNWILNQESPHDPNLPNHIH